MTRIAVIGGGISGLAAAWRLRERGSDVTLFEKSPQLGGVIRSVRRAGYLADEGPNTLVARHAVVEDAIQALRIGGERVWASEEAQRRYVVRSGRPIPLPTSPSSFLSTPILSGRAKLRLLREPFVRPGTEDDESLADFVRRRLGPEVLDYAVDPFVGGIFAGNPNRLSARYAFPTLWALERDHGSLVRGMMRRRTASATPKPSTRPFSFRAGMQTLPNALARALGDAVHTDTRVLSVSRDNEAWTLTVQHQGEDRTARFDGVVCTVPLHLLPSLGIGAGYRDTLSEVTYPPVSVLALGFERSQIAHALDGFGVLVPSREPFHVLGALFSSSLFPGRAPDGHALLTCFVGGARHPESAGLPTDDLVDLALGDLRRLLGVSGTPAFVHRALWTHAIPQAGIGYGRVLQALDDLESEHPGLRFAGNYRRGISVGEALQSGLEAAASLVP